MLCTDTSLRVVCSAWCVVSAPLVLGMDLTDTAKLEPVIPIITNKVKKSFPLAIFRHFDVTNSCEQEALAVNQAWEGHPVRSRPFLPFLLSFPCAPL